MPAGAKSPFQAAIILCGLPASGKTTLAGKIADLLVNAWPTVQVKVMDIDVMRVAIYEAAGTSSSFSPEMEQDVRARKLHEIDAALGKGLTIIDDDMNYFRSMRKQVADLACKHRVHYAIIHVDTPLKQCIAWNATRIHQVPDDVIKDVAKKLDKPGSRAYSWDEPIMALDLGKHGIDGTIAAIRKELDKAAILLQSKRPVMALLGDSSSVLGNTAFWNMALLDRIIHDGFIVNDIQEWKNTIQGTSASALDRFEVETRRAIGTRAEASGPLSPAMIKDVKRFKHDAMKTLKKEPTRLDALIAEFKAMLGLKKE